MVLECLYKLYYSKVSLAKNYFFPKASILKLIHPKYIYTVNVCICHCVGVGVGVSVGPVRLKVIGG